MAQPHRMTPPPAPSPNGTAAATVAFDRAQLEGTNINVATGLATDYLNHFNEAIMVLEMLPMAPDCKEDFLAWTPMSYCEHFAASHFKHRDLAIAAYDAADPAVREEVDEIARHMTTILLATRDGMRRNLAPATLSFLAESTAHSLRPLVARASALINGERPPAAASGQSEPQETIDALFDREVEEEFRG
jgi:hypothetical protein